MYLNTANYVIFQSKFKLILETGAPARYESIS